MKIKIGQILASALAIEFLSVAILVAMVAVLGPADPDAAQTYAQRLGVWVGPIAGFVLCLLGGWWLARRNPTSAIATGLALGCAVAAIDIALLFFSGAEFQAIFLFSNVGRIVAGTLGGWITGKG
ncbi:MAG: hypothetical protein HKN85_07515 [Gammaproteobacteria bacterium]|nr:hypothetical protein [Gammaproteobacteria bacterium]